jgi:hypothetical protein
VCRKKRAKKELTQKCVSKKKKKKSQKIAQKMCVEKKDRAK